MNVGVPELGLPPLDPMTVDRIQFRFWNVTAEFSDTVMAGFKQFVIRSSQIDKQQR